MYIAALLTIAKTRKHARCPSMDKWINKMWENITDYLFLKERNFDICYNTDNIEDIILSEKNNLHNKTPYNTTNMRYIES
jgi:hypothetical protein